MAQCSPTPSEPANNAFLLAVERDRANGALDHVGIDLDASVFDEADEPWPARERIADRLGKRALLRDRGELGFEPGLQAIDQRPGPLLPDGVARLGQTAADLGLDRTERSDARECLCRDRRVAGLGDLEEAAADMRPAEREHDLTGLGQCTIARIPIDLQDAAEALEVSDRARRFTIRCVEIGDRRRRRSNPWSVIARIGP